RGSRPHSPATERLGERRRHPRMGGQPQVVVGREVEQRPLAEANHRPLRAPERLQGPEQPSPLESGQLLGRPALGDPVHRATSGSSGFSPASSSIAMSAAYSGLPVVSSFSPKTREL